MKSFTQQEVNQIISLISKLINIAKQLDDLEDKLIDKLDNDDEEANALLDDAIDQAEVEYRKIGDELCSIGGFELMHHCIMKVPDDKGAHSVINGAWNGICGWLD